MPASALAISNLSSQHKNVKPTLDCKSPTDQGMRPCNSPGSPTPKSKPENASIFIPTLSYSNLEEGEAEEKDKLEMEETTDVTPRDVVLRARSQTWTHFFLRKLLLLAGFACAFTAGAMWNTPEWVIAPMNSLDSLYDPNSLDYPTLDQSLIRYSDNDHCCSCTNFAGLGKVTPTSVEATVIVSTSPSDIVSRGKTDHPV